MTTSFVRSTTLVCAIGLLWSGESFGLESKPRSEASRSNNGQAPPVLIPGARGSTIVTNRARIGMTYGGSSNGFPTTAMQRHIDGKQPLSAKHGDRTVPTHHERLGISRAGSSRPFGLESGTRRTGAALSGLSQMHSPGRAWSSFRRAR